MNDQNLDPELDYVTLGVSERHVGWLERQTSKVLEVIRAKQDESVWLTRARFVYLVPLVAATYPVVVVYEGVRHIGSPLEIFRSLKDLWTHNF